MIGHMNDFYSFFKFIIIIFLKILCLKTALLYFEILFFLMTIELIGLLLFFFLLLTCKYQFSLEYFNKDIC